MHSSDIARDDMGWVRGGWEVATKLGNHSVRATGITAYLKNGGTLKKAAAIANHASMHTMKLYNRRHDEMGLDEVERIRV